MISWHGLGRPNSAHLEYSYMRSISEVSTTSYACSLAHPMSYIFINEKGTGCPQVSPR